MNKIKSMFCVLFGHSSIIDMCFGYVHCGRCGDQIGDTLGSIYDTRTKVIIGHNCPTCQENYKKMTWKDKFLTPNPFKS